jgi:hypothetical protein
MTSEQSGSSGNDAPLEEPEPIHPTHPTYHDGEDRDERSEAQIGSADHDRAEGWEPQETPGSTENDRPSGEDR